MAHTDKECPLNNEERTVAFTDTLKAESGFIDDVPQRLNVGERNEENQRKSLPETMAIVVHGGGTSGMHGGEVAMQTDKEEDRTRGHDGNNHPCDGNVTSDKAVLSASNDDVGDKDKCVALRKLQKGKYVIGSCAGDTYTGVDEMVEAVRDIEIYDDYLLEEPTSDGLKDGGLEKLARCETNEPTILPEDFEIKDPQKDGPTDKRKVNYISTGHLPISNLMETRAMKRKIFEMKQEARNQKKGRMEEEVDKASQMQMIPLAEINNKLGTGEQNLIESAEAGPQPRRQP